MTTFQELDWESIAAGLLHDTVEDTNVVTFERIDKEFGETVRHIVEGETKVFLLMLLCALYYHKGSPCRLLQSRFASDIIVQKFL